MQQQHDKIVRNVPRDTWKWLWPDVLTRLLPFILVSSVAAHFTGGLASIGLIAPPQGWLAAFGIGLPVGVVMTVLAIYWRMQISPRYRLPVASDQVLQTIFYLVINAPVEEMFWRGVAQSGAIAGLERLHMPVLQSTIFGIAAVSAVFGAYHRLGGYSWKFNFAAMLAGALFGTFYVALPGPSIVVAAIIHGFTTAGFLSWGDYALHVRAMRRQSSNISPVRIIYQADNGAVPDQSEAK